MNKNFNRAVLFGTSTNYPPITKDDVFMEVFDQAENFKKYNN